MRVATRSIFNHVKPVFVQSTLQGGWSNKRPSRLCTWFLSRDRWVISAARCVSQPRNCRVDSSGCHTEGR